jgi:LytS/YehU family sensor histidine kinase
MPRRISPGCSDRSASVFNTLHGIATLISSDPQLAQIMIVNLSNLLRRSARHGDADVISLEDDLQFATEYLSIEKMRLGQRLDIRWNIQPETRQMMVPQFLLQPLLENAIKHGIAPNPQGGWMEMSSTQLAGTLQLRVSNSAGAVATQHGDGLGLSNMRARLRCLYGDDAELRFGVEHGVATASLVLPRLSAASTSGLTVKQSEAR